MSCSEESVVRQIARRLPKVQLHLHLDGSLSESFIAKRAEERGINLPCSPSDLRAHLVTLKEASQKAKNYVQLPGGNWNTFTFCNQFLQTADELEEATCEIVTLLVKGHNCRVVEIRFCPSLHTTEGKIDDDEAVAAVVKGFSQAPMVRGGVILCALRSYDELHAARIAQLAIKWKDRGVIGVDMAGDEATFPARNQLDILAKEANSAALPITVHAGENRSTKEKNVDYALKLSASRIGHGLTIAHNKQLCEKVSQKGTYVETCIIANCTSNEKVPVDSYKDHPVGEFLRNGVKVAGFNCDNLLLSGTRKNRPDPTEEIVKAKIGCGLSWTQIREVLINGANATFDRSSEPESHSDFVQKFTEEIDITPKQVLA